MNLNVRSFKKGARFRWNCEPARARRCVCFASLLPYAAGDCFNDGVFEWGGIAALRADNPSFKAC